MSIIYAGTGDAYAGSTSGTSWSGAQGDVNTIGSSHSNSQTSYDFAVYNIYSGGRGGNTYFSKRAFFPFDLSGEGGTVSSVELKIYMDNLGSTGVNDDVTIVQATALAGLGADYGNVYAHHTTWGTELVTPISVSATAAYHTFTFTSGGISRLQSAVGSGTFTLGLVGDYYDFNGNAPSLGGDYTKIKVWFADHGTSSFRPYLDITYEAVDNATFFGTNF